MRKLVYYIGVSLDGRIAGSAGEVDFYPQGQARTLPPTWSGSISVTRTLVDGNFHPTAFNPTDHKSFPNGVSVTWHQSAPG